MSDLYVLEWSRSLNSFRTQPVSVMCAHNQSAFINCLSSDDYIVIMVGSHDAIARMAHSWEWRLDDRERVLNQEPPRLFVPSAGVRLT